MSDELKAAFGGNLTHDLSTNGGPEMEEERKPTKSEADQRLASFVERAVRVMEARKEDAEAHNADLKEIIAEAKGVGYDAKILRKTAAEKVRRNRMDKDDLDEEMTLVELYYRAAGLIE